MMIKKIWGTWMRLISKDTNLKSKKINPVETEDEFISQQKKKEEEKKFFKDVQYRNLNKTPLFLGLITTVIFINCLLFFLVWMKEKIGLKDLDSSLYPLFFGANHASSIIEGKQFWRLFTFALIENNAGFFQFFISLVFVWFSLSKIGFLQELFFGTKKSAIIWGGGILIIALTQFALTKNEVVYYYGTEYLSWISVGALTYLILDEKKIKNEQARLLITSTLIKVTILLVIFGVLKFVNIKNSIGQDNDLLRITGFYISFPVFAFLVGFGITLLLNYKKNENTPAFYAISIFFVVLAIAVLFIIVWSLSKINLGQESWNRIKDFY